MSKVSELPAAAALTGTEQLYAVQSGGDVRTTAAAIAALASGGGGSAGPDLVRTKAGFWNLNPQQTGPVATSWPTINRAYFVPWFFPKPTLISAVGLNVTTAAAAGNTLRAAVFADNDNSPGAVLAQDTVLADTTGTKTVTLPTSVEVVGHFWVGVAPQGAGSPGAAWMSDVTNWTNTSWTPDNGATWGGTPTRTRFADVSGAFASNPTINREAAARIPYVALRVAP
jgi:hypothetical protein